MKPMNLTLLVILGLAASQLASAGAVHSQPDSGVSNFASIIESPALRVISDEDSRSMQTIKYQIENEFADFKTINEVHSFLDKVKLLVQKHPKNLAFAQGDVKELHKFLSSEMVTRLIRVDSELFVLPIADDRMPLVQRAIDEDELIRKLFGGPYRSLVEAKLQQRTRNEEGNHKDGNFFSNFWCKISGGCSN